MKLDPDPKLIQEIRTRRAQGQMPSEILRWMSSGNLTHIEMILQFKAAFALDLGDAACIDGWEPDGTGELKDADINGILEREITTREREHAA